MNVKEQIEMAARLRLETPTDLKVGESVEVSNDGHTWYSYFFILYPESGPYTVFATPAAAIGSIDGFIFARRHVEKKAVKIDGKSCSNSDTEAYVTASDDGNGNTTYTEYRPWTKEEAIGKVITGGKSFLHVITSAYYSHENDDCFVGFAQNVRSAKWVLNNCKQPDGSPCGVVGKRRWVKPNGVDIVAILSASGEGDEE